MSDTFSSISLMQEAFEKIGYSTKKFALSDVNFTQFTAPSGKFWLTANDHITYPLLTTSPRLICLHKHLAYEFVESLGYTVPKTVIIGADDDFRNKVQDIMSRVPLIVKPDHASLSNGLTRNVESLEGLEAAIAKARKYSQMVLVQQQVHGEEVRFVLLEGKVTAALIRQNPQVTGNGRDTLGKLIDAENKFRNELVLPYISYPQLDEVVNLEGFDMSSVPTDGEVVRLGLGTMIRDGASVYNILDTVHPTYIAAATEIGGALGTGFVVADLFIHDYTQPATAENCIFIEYNRSPVLKLFYSCRDGNQYDILKQLVPMIDRAINPTKLQES